MAEWDVCAGDGLFYYVMMSGRSISYGSETPEGVSVALTALTLDAATERRYLPRLPTIAAGADCIAILFREQGDDADPRVPSASWLWVRGARTLTTKVWATTYGQYPQRIRWNPTLGAFELWVLGGDKQLRRFTYTPGADDVRLEGVVPIPDSLQGNPATGILDVDENGELRWKGIVADSQVTFIEPNAKVFDVQRRGDLIVGVAGDEPLGPPNQVVVWDIKGKLQTLWLGFTPLAPRIAVIGTHLRVAVSDSTLDRLLTEADLQPFKGAPPKEPPKKEPPDIGGGDGGGPTGGGGSGDDNNGGGGGEVPVSTRQQRLEEIGFRCYGGFYFKENGQVAWTSVMDCVSRVRQVADIGAAVMGDPNFVPSSAEAGEGLGLLVQHGFDSPTAQVAVKQFFEGRK